MVTQGLEITDRAAGKVTRHKLRKPVEHSINIDEVVDAHVLYMQIIIKQIVSNLNFLIIQDAKKDTDKIIFNIVLAKCWILLMI